MLVVMIGSEIPSRSIDKQMRDEKSSLDHFSFTTRHNSFSFALIGRAMFKEREVIGLADREREERREKEREIEKCRIHLSEVRIRISHFRVTRKSKSDSFNAAIAASRSSTWKGKDFLRFLFVKFRTYSIIVSRSSFHAIPDETRIQRGKHHRHPSESRSLETISPVDQRNDVRRKRRSIDHHFVL